MTADVEQLAPSLLDIDSQLILYPGRRLHHSSLDCEHRFMALVLTSFLLLHLYRNLSFPSTPRVFDTVEACILCQRTVRNPLLPDMWELEQKGSGSSRVIPHIDLEPPSLAWPPVKSSDALMDISQRTDNHIHTIRHHLTLSL